MSIAFGLLGMAVPIGLIALLITLIVQRSKRHGRGLDAQGVRQFFQYLILYGLVLVAVLGLDGLFSSLLGPAGQQLGPNTQLAQALAFTLVGVPGAAILGWLTVRRHRADPLERESLMWAVHVTLGALTALIGTMVAIHRLLTMVFGVEPFGGAAVASLVIWGGFWVDYWMLARRTLTRDHDQPHVLLGSLIGLVTAATGFVALLSSAVTALTNTHLIGPRDSILGALALLLTGATAWIWYWIRYGRTSHRGVLWHVLVLPLGVGGGLIMVVVGTSLALWQTLTWFVGDSFSASATSHFSSTPDALAVAFTGLLIWWYHRAVYGQQAGERGEIDRIHEYIVAAIGLAAAATGLGTLIVAAIELVTPGPDYGISVMNTLLGALTLLVVGVPLWWFYWRRGQRAAQAAPAAELGSLTRRIYLMVLFGVAGIAAVIALLVVSYQLFVDVVAGELSLETLRAMRYGLGVVAASAAVSAYHGAVQRSDRKQGVTVHPTRGRSRVTLIGVADPALVSQIAAESHSVVEHLHAPAADPWNHAAVMDGVLAHPGEDIVVVQGPTGVQVLRIER